MTRKQEIEKIASAFAIDEVKDTCNPASKRGLLHVGFVTGAEWADQHPDIDVRTMAAWQSGYKEAIEKACEWLRTNLCEHYADEPIAHKMGRPISGYISFFEEPPVAVIGDFHKAMKGGEK